MDIELALEICSGKRPDFALGTPKCYAELAELCMHSDSQQRPTAETIHFKLPEWYSFINQPDESSEFDESDEPDESGEFYESDDSGEKQQIISEFMEADMRIHELSITLQEHPDIIYSSKFIESS